MSASDITLSKFEREIIAPRNAPPYQAPESLTQDLEIDIAWYKENFFDQGRLLLPIDQSLNQSIVRSIDRFVSLSLSLIHSSRDRQWIDSKEKCGKKCFDSCFFCVARSCAPFGTGLACRPLHHFIAEEQVQKEFKSESFISYYTP